MSAACRIKRQGKAWDRGWRGPKKGAAQGTGGLGRPGRRVLVRRLQRQAPLDRRLKRGDQPGGPSADVGRVSGERAGSALGAQTAEGKGGPEPAQLRGDQRSHLLGGPASSERGVVQTSRRRRASQESKIWVRG